MAPRPRPSVLDVYLKLALLVSYVHPLSLLSAYVVFLLLSGRNQHWYGFSIDIEADVGFQAKVGVGKWNYGTIKSSKYSEMTYDGSD